MNLTKLTGVALSAVLMSGCLLAGCTQQQNADSDAGTQAAEEQATTRTVTDGNGQEVVIPAQVERVAPTMGAFAQATEMFCAGNGKIAAASNNQISDAFKAVFTDYEKSNPNSYDSSSVEDLIAADVQVVYGPASMYSDEQLEQMRQAGIAVVTLSKLSTVDDMCDNFLTIGKILGDGEYARAQQFVEYYKQGIADAQQRASKLSDSEKHTVLQLNVSGDQYVCADDKDISNAYYEAVGAKNVAAGFDGAQSGQYRSVDAEQIVKWDPEYIITMNTRVKDQILSDTALADVAAVKNGNVYVCPTALYLWCVRSAEGALMTPWLGSVMYPDLYADQDMTKVLQDFYKDFYNTDLSDSDAANILSGATSSGAGNPQGGQGGRGGRG